MEAFRFSLNAIAPIFLLMGLGMLLGRVGLIPQRFIDDSTKLLFTIAIPALVALELVESEFRQTFDGALLAFSVIGLVVAVVLLQWIVPRLIRETPSASAFVQGCFRGNIIILGIPVITNICGGPAAARLAMVAAIVGPLYSLAAVLIFADCAAQTGADPPRGGARLRLLTKLTLTNPIVIGCVAGVIGSVLGLGDRLPQPVLTALDDLAALVLPLSLLVQGADIRFRGAGPCMGRALAAAGVKTVVLPLLALGIAWALGFRGMDLAVLMIVFGAPASVSSFAMSHQMGGDHKLSSMIIVFSNVICLGTIFSFVLVLRLMGQI